MSCHKRLLWYELVPIFSFLGLKGRCRNCKTKISIQYPLVEFATGLIFASLFLKFSGLFYEHFFMFGITFDYYAVMFSILLVIAVYDLRHKIIPDTLAFIFGVLAFVGLFFFDGYFFSPHIPSVLEFFSGVIVALPFALFWLISGGRWMGLGDAKLSLGIGWLLGIPLAFSGMALAFWFGAIIGIILLVFFRNRKISERGMKSEIPFAPFLVLGAFLAFILDLQIFTFYG